MRCLIQIETTEEERQDPEWEDCEPAVEGEKYCQSCLDFFKSMDSAVQDATVESGCLTLTLPDGVFAND